MIEYKQLDRIHKHNSMLIPDFKVPTLSGFLDNDSVFKQDKYDKRRPLQSTFC